MMERTSTHQHQNDCICEGEGGGFMEWDAIPQLHYFSIKKKKRKALRWVWQNLLDLGYGYLDVNYIIPSICLHL